MMTETEIQLNKKLYMSTKLDKEAGKFNDFDKKVFMPKISQY